MPERQYFINDPDFCEFVYNCMATASTEERMNLNVGELTNFKSKSTMRRFADNESTEKRLLLLARIGIQFCVICAPKSYPVTGLLDEVVTQYKIVEKRQALTEAMAKKKVFIISSNHVLIAAHMAAQNSHSQVYVLNYDYLRFSQKLSEIKTEKARPDLIKESMAGFDLLAKISYVVGSSDIIAESICNVTKNELAILLVLYSNRHTFTSDTTIALKLNESIRSQGVSKVCTNLEKNGYLVREPGHDRSKARHRNNKYMIISKGIDAVMHYMKFIQKQVL